MIQTLEQAGALMFVIGASFAYGTIFGWYLRDMTGDVFQKASRWMMRKIFLHRAPPRGGESQ